MRIIFTLLTALLTASLSAQIMYDDVETTRLNNYGLNIPFPDQLGNGIGGTEWPGWHGVLVQYTANPYPDAINESPTVISYSRNPAEVYDVILVNTGLMADLTDYVAGTKTFTMDVWSPIPGITFQVTLENTALAGGGYPEGRHSEYQATTTTGSAWETLTFELTGEPWSQEANNSWWPDAATAHNDVDRYVILINPGNQSGETFFLDNIEGPELAEEPCTEAPVELMVNDADCNQNFWYPTYMDGRMSLVLDPAGDQDDNCLEYARNGGASDDVIVGNFGGALPLGDNPKVFVDLYDLEAPTTFFMSIQDANGTELAGQQVSTTASNTWESFELDFSAISNFPTATNFVILVDAGNPVPKTIYMDNIRLENEVSVEEQVALDVKLFPNPVQDELSVTGLDGFGSWEMRDAQGRIVAQGEGMFSGTLRVSTQGLTVGTYTFTARVGDQRVTKPVIKS